MSVKPREWCKNAEGDVKLMLVVLNMKVPLAKPVARRRCLIPYDPKKHMRPAAAPITRLTTTIAVRSTEVAISTTLCHVKEQQCT